MLSPLYPGESVRHY